VLSQPRIALWCSPFAEKLAGSSGPVATARTGLHLHGCCGYLLLASGQWLLLTLLLPAAPHSLSCCCPRLLVPLQSCGLLKLPLPAEAAAESVRRQLLRVHRDHPNPEVALQAAAALAGLQ
jgi:hypothetical protein